MSRPSGSIIYHAGAFVKTAAGLASSAAFQSYLYIIAVRREKHNPTRGIPI